MHRTKLGRRGLTAFLLAASALAIGAVFGTAGNGNAAGSAAPTNQNPPTISGSTDEGATLTASTGTWNGTAPLTYTYDWRRCDDTGGSCSSISGANDKTYTLKAVDVSNTLRVRVTAKNSEGSAGATSVPTAVVKAKAAPPPTTVNGCPTSGTGTLDIATITSPAHLVIDGQQVSPSPVTKSATDITARFHVSACNGRSVSGALVYATAVPFQQFSIPAETATGTDGWVTLTMHQESAFPASPRQQILAVFVRARKSGENLLGGISARRLVSFRVQV